jgi:uncharacterized damage-inducible protein DinB
LDIGEFDHDLEPDFSWLAQDHYKVVAMNALNSSGTQELTDFVNEILDEMTGLVRSALAGSTQKIPFDFSSLSANEIASTFDSQHDELVTEVSKLTPEQLREEVEFHGRSLRRGVLLWFMTEHEIHHRGQLYTYYRLAGIEPPNLHE